MREYIKIILIIIIIILIDILKNPKDISQSLPSISYSLSPSQLQGLLRKDYPCFAIMFIVL